MILIYLKPCQRSRLRNVTGLHLMVTMQDAAVPAQNEELADGTEEVPRRRL